MVDETHATPGVAQKAREPAPAVVVEDVQAAIDRALADREALPRYEDLCRLYVEVRRHADVLLPIVAQRINALNKGTPEWDGKRCRLDLVTHELNQGLGEGLQSAARRVRSLGHTLRWLLDASGQSAPEGDR
ncbi:DUF6415 family natural product biosynthesis protein [Streptomyces pactum]|nr:DUF6415 family natural product biosynthesis protein [Streptomyces pactum]